MNTDMELQEKLNELDEKIAWHKRWDLGETERELCRVQKDLKLALIALEFYANEKDEHWFAADLEGTIKGSVTNAHGTKARETLKEILTVQNRT